MGADSDKARSLFMPVAAAVANHERVRGRAAADHLQMDGKQAFKNAVRNQWNRRRMKH